MNKFLIVGIGIAAGLLTLFFLAPLTEGLLVMLLTGEEVSFSIGGIRLNADYSFLGSINIIFVTLIILSPVLVSITAVELSLLRISKAALDKTRSILIVYILVNTAYLIFTIFTGILSMILQSKIDSIWTEWIKYLNVDSTQKLLIMFAVLFIVFIYLNLTSKRMRSIIPSIKQHQNINN